MASAALEKGKGKKKKNKTNKKKPSQITLG